MQRGLACRGPRKKILEGLKGASLEFDGDPFQKNLWKAADHFEWHADEVFPLHKKSSTRCVDIRREESNAEPAAFERVEEAGIESLAVGKNGGEELGGMVLL